MKKLLFVLFAGLLMTSCGSTKMEREAMHTVKGDWILTDISYPGNSGFVDVKLFGDADANCFRNSTWHFISNNNEGNYSLSGNNCRSAKQNFTWNIQASEADPSNYNFTLKPVGEGQNARRIDKGYRVKLTRLTQSEMVLRQNVRYEGESFTIKMKFAKNY